MSVFGGPDQKPRTTGKTANQRGKIPLLLMKLHPKLQAVDELGIWATPYRSHMASRHSWRVAVAYPKLSIEDTKREVRDLSCRKSSVQEEEEDGRVSIAPKI
jgi:hypothetical protein